MRARSQVDNRGFAPLPLTAGEKSGLVGPEKDLPELLSFFSFPRRLWPKLRTTNVIERLFVEVRRRTRPMVCFVHVKSVDRIIYSTPPLQPGAGKSPPLQVFTQAA